MSYEIDTIPLDNVSIKGGTQSRAALNESTINEYAEAIRNGVDFPPIVTFFDGVNFWLADGFHRYHAHRAAGAMEINAELREGTCRDAILYSVGANVSHGLRRTNEDKRKAVLTLLNDAEWATWSGRDIAKACGVSHTFVDSVKSSLATVASEKSTEVTYTTKHGTTATMNTANIGKNQSTAALENESDSIKPVHVKQEVPQEEDDDSTDLAQLASDLQRENEAYQRQIASIESNDLAAEVVRLNTQLDQLNGRLQGEITTRNEAQKQAKYYADLLGKIRKVLNVETNKEILTKLAK